jgi:hypothetical protein
MSSSNFGLKILEILNAGSFCKSLCEYCMAKLSQYQSQVTLYLSTLFRYGNAKFKTTSDL